jgi:hypothetical protein
MTHRGVAETGRTETATRLAADQCHLHEPAGPRAPQRPRSDPLLRTPSPYTPTHLHPTETRKPRAHPSPRFSWTAMEACCGCRSGALRPLRCGVKRARWMVSASPDATSIVPLSLSWTCSACCSVRCCVCRQRGPAQLQPNSGWHSVGAELSAVTRRGLVSTAVL